MILSFLFFAFLFYVLFKLVFDFVLPIYRTTKKVKQSFQEMNQRMQEQQGSSNTANRQQANTSQQKPVGDYIDFEEVKDK